MSFVESNLLLILSFSSFLISLVFVGIWQYILRSANILDKPNYRSSHVTPTPRAGGVGIFISYFLAVGIYFAVTGDQLADEFYLFAGCSLIFFTGLWDDFYPASRRVRFLAQIIAAALILFWLVPVLDRWLSSWELHWILIGLIAGVLLIGLVWSINLYNFMDGIDGIAGMETVFIASSVAILLIFKEADELKLVYLLILVFSTLGFLWWNYPKAKVFLGDSGSGFLGLLVASLSYWAYFSETIGLLTLLTLGSLFWLDASLTIGKRLIQKEKIWEAHREHGYQILSRQWNSHSLVTFTYGVVNTFLVFPVAYIIEYNPKVGVVLFLSLVSILTFLYFKISNMERIKSGSRASA